MTSTPSVIHQLVSRFSENLPAYRSGHYNETQLRREFLDPFFEQMGWDVFNKQGYAEAYKDVVHEDAIKVQGKSQAPDYAFRIGGVRKFFVEAKKPSVNIKEDISPAYQLRRYAWSAKLPLSILTDFEEFAIYECRSKPDRTDKVSTGRLFLFTFRDYIEKWDEITSIFSRESILKGSFDRFAESTAGKHGTAEVDHAFLAEIERWRDILARNLALRNPQVTQRDLNFAVQMTIDRIIFLRIAEDRGIEQYGALQELTKGDAIYPRLVQLFNLADARYNSGLFHFSEEKNHSDSPDHLTPHLSLDDKPLKDILNNLYYPDSPYEFSVLPADILGQVYEQFLGKVIRLTAGHHAVVEDKPEVKKAGGVFYTPTYIVEYIVQHTLGELLKNIHPGEIGAGRGTPIRVLDPACGSGSFLLGAYQYLLDWYRDGYIADGAEKWVKGANPKLVQVGSSDWKLTTYERKRILLDHIHGVDIDPQAVEVTKLSLLLKVLEGESEQTIGKQLSLFKERVLPDLNRNIQCGNSLIGSDFYSGQQTSFLGLEEQYRINAFDWDKAFPQVFLSSGGFDVIIGNPPYVRQEGLGKEKGYFLSHYQSFVQTADLYVNFLEKGLTLLSPQGISGMIVSNKWLRSAYGRSLRKLLVEKATINSLVDLAGLPVFKNATVRTIIIIYQKNKADISGVRYLAPLPISEFNNIHNGADLDTKFVQNSILLPITSLSADNWFFSQGNTQNLLEKLGSKSVPLPSYIKGKPYFGIKTGLNKAFIIDKVLYEKFVKENPKNSEILKPMVVGRDLRRYSITHNHQYLIWTYIGVPISQYPEVLNHLKQYQSELQKRWDKGNYWWELRACDYYERFQQPKIIFPDIANECRFCLDNEGFFSTNSTYFLPGSDLFLLAVLNSKVGKFYFSQICASLEGGNTKYLRFFGQYIENFPVHVVDFSNAHESNIHKRIVTLADHLLKMNNDIRLINNPTEKTILQRQIETTDREIDRLVYELYGLTAEEIAIIENDK